MLVKSLRTNPGPFEAEGINTLFGIRPELRAHVVTARSVAGRWWRHTTSECGPAVMAEAVWRMTGKPGRVSSARSGRRQPGAGDMCAKVETRP